LLADAPANNRRIFTIAFNFQLEALKLQFHTEFRHVRTA
jgi:hypothetical protein